MKKVILLIALSPLSAQAWWFGNYDDCVLDNMKEGLSAAGVVAVRAACRNKYPPKVVKYPLDNYVPPLCFSVDLTNEEIGNIKLQPDGSFYSIWNGNKFEVFDLVFTLQYQEKNYDNTVKSSNEVNKNAGNVSSETAQSTIPLGFPSNIYSYTVIKATKLSCK